MTDGPSYPGDPYPPPTPGPHPFRVGNAFSYGWAKFKDNLGPMVVAALLLFVVTIVAEIVGSIITGAASGGSGFNFSGDSTGGMMFGGDLSAAGQLTSP